MFSLACLNSLWSISTRVGLCKHLTRRRLFVRSIIHSLIHSIIHWFTKWIQSFTKWRLFTSTFHSEEISAFLHQTLNMSCFVLLSRVLLKYLILVESAIHFRSCAIMCQFSLTSLPLSWCRLQLGFKVFRKLKIDWKIRKFSDQFSIFFLFCQTESVTSNPIYNTSCQL